MAYSKLTCDEMAERIRQLETRHELDLKRIEEYKEALAENSRGREDYERLSGYIGASKESEEALAEAHRRLKATLEAIPDLMFEVDAGGRIYDYHRQSDEALYVPPEQFLGKTVSQVLPEEVSGIILKALAQAAVEGRHRGATYALDFDSGRRWFELSISVKSQGPNLQDARYIVLARDITERKKGEEALRSSELKYRSLFEGAEDGIFLLDAAGFIDCNDAGARMYGTAKEYLIGKSPMDLSPEYQPDGRLSADVAKEKTSEALKGTTQKFEWAYRRAGGAVFDVEITLSRIGDAESTLLLAIVRDITGRKQAQQALKRSQENLAEAQRQTHIGSFEYDFLAEKSEWSEEMFRIFGIERKDFQGKEDDFLTRIHPEDAGYVDEAIDNWLHQTSPLDLRFRIARPGGDIRFIRMTFENTLDELGNPLRTIGTFQDVTEQVKLESERVRLENQLRQAQKMESVGRLAGGIAHDFNNMLGVILGHVDLALEQVDPADPIHEDLAGIQKAARHSANLTRQLLAFARKQTIAPQILDLNETIAGTLKMLQRMIGENIQIEWKPAADLWPVKVDPFQIDQILANLCINARDAIADVGRITIEADNLIAGADYCSARGELVPGEYVRLAVKDNGCGMRKEVLEHIFEPFFTTKGVGKGTGLGLAMVYGAVMQNGGFIHVESEPGAGTAFSIYFPRQKAQVPASARQVRATRQGNETILVVEDEPGLLRLVTALLKKQGYGVLAAGGPAEALRLAGEHAGEIHLLLTDVIMPEMNGRVLAQNLRSTHPHLKCLFMSGYTADSITNHGLLDENDFFIQKPFSAKDLAHQLSVALG